MPLPFLVDAGLLVTVSNLLKDCCVVVSCLLFEYFYLFGEIGVLFLELADLRI